MGFLNYRHLCPGARGKAARNSLSRDGVRRSPRRSNVTFSRILCATPRAARVWATFSQKTSSHSRGVEKFLHFATPLEREPLLAFWPTHASGSSSRVFSRPFQKKRFSLGRCRQNRDLDFYSGFADKNGAPKVHYFQGGRLVFKTEGKFSMKISCFSYRLEFAREFPGFGRPQTLRTRGIRGVGFSRASVARVWRVLGRSNPGNSRADVISKIKNSRISRVWAFRNAPHSRNSRGRFCWVLCGSSLARSRTLKHWKFSSG